MHSFLLWLAFVLLVTATFVLATSCKTIGTVVIPEIQPWQRNLGVVAGILFSGALLDKALTSSNIPWAWANPVLLLVTVPLVIFSNAQRTWLPQTPWPDGLRAFLAFLAIIFGACVFEQLRVHLDPWARWIPRASDRYLHWLSANMEFQWALSVNEVGWSFLVILDLLILWRLPEWNLGGGGKPSLKEILGLVALLMVFPFVYYAASGYFSIRDCWNLTFASCFPFYGLPSPFK